MKRILRNKKMFWIYTSILAVILGVITYAGVDHVVSNRKPISQVDEVGGEMASAVKRKVYLISKSGYVVPVTVSFEKKTDLGEEIYYIFSLMRGGSKLITKGYSEVLPASTKINTLEVSNGILTVDFSKEFAGYEVGNELRIIEAMAWTANQYPEVSSLKIKVEGEELTHMPVGHTPLPNELNKSFGINNHVFSYKAGANRMVAYYQMTINDKTAYVPVSKTIDSKEITVSTVSNLLQEKAPLITGLELIEEVKSLDIVGVNLEGNKLKLELGVTALTEENLVSQDLYEALLVCMSDVANIQSVTITVAGEEVAVSGYQNIEDVTVGSIYYNEIYL